MNKIVFALLISFALPFAAFANDQLADDMRQMSTDFKAMKAQINDASKNASTIEYASDMVKAVEASIARVPDSVAALPDDQKQKQLEAYVALMNEVKAKVIELVTDLNQGNNAAAAAIITQLNNLKVQGHLAFNS